MEGRFMEVTDITAGYSERVARMALFEPLQELDRKKMTDLDGQQIDMRGLGLLTLLYFFEQKLIRNQRSGVKELAIFIEQVTAEHLRVGATEYEELARSVIQTFRPSSGKKKEFNFFNWETKQNETLYFSILKANSFDVKTNSQYYTLDEDGLELVFATKEFYSEFQLSINQLVLRKQLEKGEFKGALRQINEMRIDVEALEERMEKLAHEIKRNIVSEDTYSRYQSLLEDIYFRLNLENEEFEELHQFVKETKDRLYYKDNTSKERRTYEYILEISKELEEVHAEHTTLLQKSIDLKNSAMQAAQESLYYVGIDSFNFDQDITSRIISAPLPLESMKGLLAPFLKIDESSQWSLMTIFAEQNMREEREASEEDSFLQISEADSQRYQDLISGYYTKLMELLLEALFEKTSITLTDFFTYIRNTNEEQLLEKRALYDFIMVLHHRSPLQNGDATNQDDGNTHLLAGVMTLLGQRSLTVQEVPGTIQGSARFSIQNMIISLGDESVEF